MKLDYDIIGKGLTVRMRLNDLSHQDKARLWAELGDQLGVTKWANDHPDDSEAFQIEWSRVMKEAEL